MSKVLIEEATLSNIGTAIREQNGATTTYLPSEMPTAISNLSIGNSNDQLELEFFRTFAEGSWYGYPDSTHPASITISSLKTIRKLGQCSFYNGKGGSLPYTNVTFSNATSIFSGAFLEMSYGWYSNYYPKVHYHFPKVTNIGVGSKKGPIFSDGNTTIGYTGVTHVYFDSLTSINGGTVNSSETPFYNSQLQYIYMPKLESYTYTPGLLTGTYVFNIALPSLKAIDDSLCSRDHALESLVLSQTSNTVCTLSSVKYLPSSITNASDTTGYVYVPEALLASYQTATNWATFSTKIRAIESYQTELSNKGVL